MVVLERVAGHGKWVREAVESKVWTWTNFATFHDCPQFSQATGDNSKNNIPKAPDNKYVAVKHQPGCSGMYSISCQVVIDVSNACI